VIFLEKIENVLPDIPDELVEKAAGAALSHPSVPEDARQADLTVVLTDDAQLQALNREYLGTDAPTDVLSFPSDQTDPQTGSRYLGDILISVPRAGQQAAGAGHPVEAEVQLLVVHGVLHLLGHDHAEAGEKARMWAAQAEILAQLGLAHIQVRES
jgi:probable rRNA maturation factor